MEVIKTKRYMGYDVTLVRFGDPKGYEVQISRKPYDEITDYFGTYTTLKKGLKIFGVVIKAIKNEEYEIDSPEVKKRKEINKKIKLLMTLKGKIYQMARDYPESMTLRYIECEPSEDSVYFVAEDDYCKTPKRFSTYDFEKKNLFFDKKEACEYGLNRAKSHVNSIRNMIKEDEENGN